ncbi:hypothetical protein [Cognaticolwellia beringensis]|uniref:Uncharacterized protein n=1 Tax=Cognaticolwellia beringensis TaxID=1967665 RepID=A0A222GC40_9GAMM|nr:hypothetical protein [Cognaticolwellia beringensis]ASP49262.1 hypothetical protein B5D82_16690 [Cognaticolwellia beringensis]
MHNNFWDYLYETTELIENMANEKQDIIEQVYARLENVELLYERNFDPVDSYEEYVAVKLIRAISQAIKR